MLGTMAIPFADDGGGSVFFLDLETTPAAVCVLVLDDMPHIVPLSPSFESFINGLGVSPFDL